MEFVEIGRSRPPRVRSWPDSPCRVRPAELNLPDRHPRSLMRPKGAEVRCIVLAQYWPILLFIGVAAGLGVVLLAIGMLAGPRRPEAIKLAAYECGFEAFEDARMRFDVRYYLLAILFIIFDLEIAFLFPWAVVFQHIGVVALIEMALFLLLLVVGFAYVWKKGALEWE
jgi:NADH-quinone oxidoreductase subunit A